MIACIVPLCKDKEDVYECRNSMGISLLSLVGKVYGKILTNGIRKNTECDHRRAEWI